MCQRKEREGPTAAGECGQRENWERGGKEDLSDLFPARQLGDDFRNFLRLRKGNKLSERDSRLDPFPQESF